LWILLGLVPALHAGWIAVVWTSLAGITLITGILTLHRYPDTGTLVLGLILPVTLVPPFVLGRETSPLLASLPMQLLAGAVLAATLTAVSHARRRPGGPAAGRPLTPADRSTPRATRRARQAVQVATLITVAVWLALPVRAMIDPTLVEGPLGATDPIRARILLLAVSWIAAAAITLGAVVPPVSDASTDPDAGSAPPARLLAASIAGLAAWALVVCWGV
jgi:hypothetical protein